MYTAKTKLWYKNHRLRKIIPSALATSRQASHVSSKRKYILKKNVRPEVSRGLQRCVHRFLKWIVLITADAS